MDDGGSDRCGCEEDATPAVDTSPEPLLDRVADGLAAMGSGDLAQSG